MISRKGVAAVILAILAIVPFSASAQRAGASFLSIPSSPRAYSLGQTNVAALGAEAIGRNPANLGLMSERIQLFSSLASVMGGTQYGHLAAAYAPSGNKPWVDALGVSMTRLQASGFENADASGIKTGGSFGASDTAMALSASRTVTAGLRAGATAKLIKSEIAGYSSSWGPAADLGVTYTFGRFSRPMSVAASVTNFGPGIKLLDSADPLPTSLNLGAAVPVSRALVVLEVNRMIPQRRTELGLGAELPLGAVSLRAGYLMENSGPNLAARDDGKSMSLLHGLTFGVGVKAGMIKFDYAVSQQATDYGMTQRLALTFLWGDPERVVARAMSRRYDRSGWLENY